MNRKEILKLEGRELDQAVGDIVYDTEWMEHPVKGEVYAASPEYSTDLNDAMLVVDKMRERGWRKFHLEQWHDETWSANFQNPEGKWEEPVNDIESPAEAICRSALLALNGE